MKALIAGGAGGIGTAICQRAVDSGYEVTIADLDGDRAAEVATKVGALQGVGADLTTEEGAAHAVATATDGKPLDALVNAQGISPKKDGGKRPFYEIDIAEWTDVLSVNLASVFLVTKAAYAHLVQADRASIVNISSIMAKIGAGGPEGASFPPFSPSAAHYAASKAGVQNFTLSVARELAPQGVRCNAVAPGYVGTGMGGTTSPEVDAVMRPQIPLGRAATVEEIAATVAFLLSQEAGYITGEVIDVNGGWHAD